MQANQKHPDSQGTKPPDGASLDGNLQSFLNFCRVEKGLAVNSIQSYQLDLGKLKAAASKPLRDLNGDDLNDYVESQQQIYVTSSGSAPNLYMTSAYTDFANPAIRIQQSTPTPQLPQGFAQPPMLSANNTNTGLESWNNYGNVQGQSLQLR